MAYRLCIPMHRDPTRTFLNLHQICIEIPQFVPPHKIPPGDPWEHLQALTTIAQLAGSLSDKTPMRQELVDVAQRALDTAVAGLGEGVEIVAPD